MCTGVSTVNWASAGTANRRGETVTARFHVVSRASPLPSLYLFHMTPMLDKVADQWIHVKNLVWFVRLGSIMKQSVSHTQRRWVHSVQSITRSCNGLLRSVPLPSSFKTAKNRSNGHRFPTLPPIPLPPPPAPAIEMAHNPVYGGIPDPPYVEHIKGCLGEHGCQVPRRPRKEVSGSWDPLWLCVVKAASDQDASTLCVMNAADHQLR